GDKRFQDYALKDFNFIFDHLAYFRAQAKEFGPQRAGYGRLLDMHELDDCGAIGAALIKAYDKNKDPRYRQAIDQVAAFIAQKQMRMPDGTLARPRPQPVSLWADDAYMSIRSWHRWESSLATASTSTTLPDRYCRCPRAYSIRPTTSMRTPGSRTPRIR